MASSLLPRPRRFAAARGVLRRRRVPIAGCGDSGSSSSPARLTVRRADPAALLPASAPVYVEAQLRPTGDLAANAKTVAGKILRTSDPGGKIVGLIDGAAKDDGASYAKDIEPWLGQRAGIGDHVGRRGRQDDVDAGRRDRVQGRRRRPEVHRRAAKGATTASTATSSTSYKADDDLAAAVVDHAVLIGTEKAFKSAIDAQSGAGSLATAGAFKKARVDGRDRRPGLRLRRSEPVLRPGARRGGGHGRRRAPTPSRCRRSRGC